MAENNKKDIVPSIKGKELGNSNGSQIAPVPDVKSGEWIEGEKVVGSGQTSKAGATIEGEQTAPPPPKQTLAKEPVEQPGKMKGWGKPSLWFAALTFGGWLVGHNAQDFADKKDIKSASSRTHVKFDPKAYCYTPEQIKELQEQWKEKQAQKSRDDQTHNYAPISASPTEQLLAHKAKNIINNPNPEPAPGGATTTAGTVIGMIAGAIFAARSRGKYVKKLEEAQEKERQNMDDIIRRDKVDEINKRQQAQQSGPPPSKSFQDQAGNGANNTAAADHEKAQPASQPKTGYPVKKTFD